MNIKNISTTSSLEVNDSIVKCNCASKAITVNLPKSTNFKGQYTIKKADTTANAVTIKPIQNTVSTCVVAAVSAVTDILTVTSTELLATETNKLRILLTTAGGDTLAVTKTDSTNTINIALANSTAAKNTAALIQAAIRALYVVGGVSVVGVTCTAGGNWDSAAVATGETAAIYFTGGEYLTATNETIDGSTTATLNYANDYITLVAVDGGWTIIDNSSTSYELNRKVILSTDYETSGTDDELIKLISTTNKAKALIAYYDINNAAKTWLQQHDYLHYYNPITFVATDVNTTTNVITKTHGLPATTNPTSTWRCSFSSDGTLPAGIASAKTFTATEVGTDKVTIVGHGLTTGMAVRFAKGTTVPTGLTDNRVYYVAVSGNDLSFYITSTLAIAAGATGKIAITASTGTGTHTLTPYYYVYYSSSTAMLLYDTSANATTAGATGKLDITDTGTGTHTLTPDNAYKNNKHLHFGIESADSTGAKQTRLSIPYGFDTTEMGVFSANLNVNGGKVRINGEAGTNREYMIGGVLSDNHDPDLSNLRWGMRCDSTAEAGANAGSDFKLVYYSDVGVAQANAIAIKRSTGYVAINDTPVNATAPLTINANHIRIKTARTPASATAAGNAGDICWDANYIYVCVATNSWTRSAIAAW